MILYQEKLNPCFSHKINGLIWKVQTNENKALLSIESRDFELKQVAFTVLNFETGKVHFSEKTFEERWKLNLAFTGEESLILNGYEHTESQESKGLMSINVQNGAILWERYNLSLDSANPKGLRVFDPKINPRRYSWIEPLSGETIAEPEDIAPESATILFPKPNDQSVLPGFVLASEIIGEVVTLTYQANTIASFHEKAADKIQQRILVYQGDRILHDNILIKDIQKLQPESFFIQKNRLFYIRNKNEIVSFLV